MSGRVSGVSPHSATRRGRKGQTQGGAKNLNPTGTRNRKGQVSELLKELRRANANRPYLRGYGDHRGRAAVIADYDDKYVRAKKFLGSVPATATKFERAILSFTRKQKLRHYKNKPRSSSIASCVSAALERVNAGCLSVYGEPLVIEIDKPKHIHGPKKMYVLADKFRSKKFTKLDKDLFEVIAYSRYGPSRGHPKPGKTVIGTVIDNKLWRSKTSVSGLRALTYKGTGIPGALAMLGYANCIKGSTIWNPQVVSLGAALQFWGSKNIENVGEGGHAGILERYIYNERRVVVGFCYSDQWWNYDIVRRTRNSHKFGGYKLVYAAKYKM